MKMIGAWEGRGVEGREGGEAGNTGKKCRFHTGTVPPAQPAPKALDLQRSAKLPLCCNNREKGWPVQARSACKAGSLLHAWAAAGWQHAAPH